MKQYPQFFIKVDEDDTATFYAAVARALCNGWTFHRTYPDLERRTGYIYVREERPGWPPVALAMVRTDSETIRIANIIPKEDWLTIDRYKAVLEDFQSSILQKVTNCGFAITLQMGDDEIHLDRLMPAMPFRLLQGFADTANKNTGSSHLCDRDRWYRFLLCLHVHGHQVTPDLIGQWAREQGFSDRAASTMEHEFDFALGLLAAIRYGQPRQTLSTAAGPE